MVKKKEREIDSNKNFQSVQYRKMPLYAILLCGFLISLMGLYLLFRNDFAIGRSLPSKYGQGGGEKLIVNGSFTLFAGLIICIPIYQLTKQSKRKKKHNHS